MQNVAITMDKFLSKYFSAEWRTKQTK